MDVASSIIAERVTAALAVRVWSLRHCDEGCHAILLVKGAGALCRSDHQDVELQAPILIWTPPNARGRIELGAGGEGYKAFIASRLVQRTASDPIMAAHRPPSLQQMTLVGADQLASGLPSLITSFDALVVESREMAAGASAAIGLHLGLVILHLWRCAEWQGTHGRSGQTTLERFDRLIEMHYREHLHISDYAGLLGVSQAHLHETCVRLGGRTPLSFVHERLLEEAKARLRQNEFSVEQIGYGLGFRDPGYFSRFFKRLTGQSPGAFQRSTGTRPRQPPSSFAAWP